jgi:transposase
MGRGTGRGRLKAMRQVSRVFWSAVVAGASTEAAAAAAGLSVEVGHRWFRQAGGVLPLSLGPPSGRYLSLVEPEEIGRLGRRRGSSADRPQPGPGTIDGQP